MLLYNKMELGDLNANFSLEVESQVKMTVYLLQFVVSISPSNLLVIFTLSLCLCFLACPEGIQLELLHS